MNKRYCLAAMLLPVLAGCSSLTKEPQQPDLVHQHTYTCTDGQIVEAAYPDPQVALVRIKGQTHALQRAVSGDGSRYTGDGWQWWIRGDDGTLAPLAMGETVASAEGLACRTK